MRYHRRLVIFCKKFRGRCRRVLQFGSIYDSAMKKKGYFEGVSAAIVILGGALQLLLRRPSHDSLLP